MHSLGGGVHLVCQHQILEGLEVHKGHEHLQHLLHDLIPAPVQHLHQDSSDVDSAYTDVPSLDTALPLGNAM